MPLPEIDPIIIQIGWISIRWYSLTWIAAFLTIYFLIKNYQKDLNTDQVSDLMFYSLLGAILGGRAGYVFFYSIEQFFNKPKNSFCLEELKKGNSIRKSAISSDISAAQALKVKKFSE